MYGLLPIEDVLELIINRNHWNQDEREYIYFQWWRRNAYYDNIDDFKKDLRKYKDLFRPALINNNQSVHVL